MRRDQIVLSVDESVGNSAASASAPATVISSTVSQLGEREGRDGAEKTHRASGFRSAGDVHFVHMRRMRSYTAGFPCYYWPCI